MKYIKAIGILVARIKSVSTTTFAFPIESLVQILAK